MDEIQPVIMENKRFDSRKKIKDWLFWSASNPMHGTFSKILILNYTLLLQRSLSRLRFVKFSRLFPIWKQIINIYFLRQFPSMKFALRGNKGYIWLSFMFLKVRAKLTDTLLNEMLPVVCSKTCSFLQEKSDRLYIQAISVHQICDAKTISRGHIIHRCAQFPANSIHKGFNWKTDIENFVVEECFANSKARLRRWWNGYRRLF